MDACREKLVQAYVQAIVEPRCWKAERIGDGKDDVFNEDEKVFSEKMNRWVRESAEGLATDEFWLHIEIGHIPRAPVDRFSRWLQTQRMQKALGSKRSMIDVV